MPDLVALIDELKEIDPHDSVKPDTFFMTENDMRGYAWSLFLQKVKKYSVRS